MNTSTPPFLQRLPRLSGWLFITVLLLVSVWAIAPQQLAVSLYKLSLVSLAAVVGYWLDRSIFPYARPDWFMHADQLAGGDGDGAMGFGLQHDNEASIDVWDSSMLLLAGVSMLRRAIIIGCAMLTMGLGA